MDKSKNVKCILKDSEEYPLRMKELKGMPKKLYVRGNLPMEDKPTVAIVGARGCSNYGRNMAREYARIFSEEGVQVISGLALGIDGEAHVGALHGRTPTYGVLANDVAVCYPRSNGRIYDRILEQGGGIIGEQPQGAPALVPYFPARNRIISALSDLVLVVEAKLKSGSLITVDFALEQGKSVYAIPGRVGDLLSEGCNKLISQGAGIAYSPDVILQELKGSSSVMADNAMERKVLKMSPKAQLLFQQMEQEPLSLENLCRRVPFAYEEILSGILELQLEGAIMEVGKNYYVKSSKFVNGR